MDTPISRTTPIGTDLGCKSRYWTQSPQKRSDINAQAPGAVLGSLVGRTDGDTVDVPSLLSKSRLEKNITLT